MDLCIFMCVCERESGYVSVYVYIHNRWIGRCRCSIQECVLYKKMFYTRMSKRASLVLGHIPL